MRSTAPARAFSTARNNPLKTPARLARNLSEWGSMGDWRLLFLNRDRIEQVTPEDVARVAKLYLKASNHTIGKFIPEDAPDRTVVTPAPDLEATLRNYTGKAAVEEGEAFDPYPRQHRGPRQAHHPSQRHQAGVCCPRRIAAAWSPRSWSCTSAMRPASPAKPPPRRWPAGCSAAAPRNTPASSFRMKWTRLKIQVRATGALNGANASITADRATLPDALRLAAEILRQPSFPESDFEQNRQAALARLESTPHQSAEHRQ